MIIQCQIGYKLLQLEALIFQLLKFNGFTDFHPTKFALPALNLRYCLTPSYAKNLPHNFQKTIFGTPTSQYSFNTVAI